MKKPTLTALALIAVSLAAADTIPLKPEMFSTKGTVETCMEEDGLTSIHLKGITGAESAGSKYLDARINLPTEIDLTGKMITLTVKTNTPDILRGFYFRAYNNGEKAPALSFQSWRSPVKDSYQKITLHPRRNINLAWEDKVVSGSEPGRINRFSFHLGTPAPNAEMDLLIKSIEFSDDLFVLAPSMFRGLEFAGIGRTNFSRAPEFVIKETDGVVSLTCLGVAPVESKQTNRYEAMALAVKPIDLTGKIVKFEFKGSANINGFYVRFFNEKARKASWSFVRASVPGDWTAATLQAGADGDGFRWQAAEVDREAAARITRIDFIFSCPKGGESFQLAIRNLSAE